MPELPEVHTTVAGLNTVLPNKTIVNVWTDYPYSVFWKDKENITLTLNPEVSEATANAFEYSGEVKLPKFTMRNLNTNIVVQNGDTIVLGGLIKESKTNTRTKVPFLGDLPIVGSLFRKNSDSTTRKNLLIFVTASILSPEGEELK